MCPDARRLNLMKQKSLSHLAEMQRCGDAQRVPKNDYRTGNTLACFVLQLCPKLPESESESDSDSGGLSTMCNDFSPVKGNHRV